MAFLPHFTGADDLYVPSGGEQFSTDLRPANWQTVDDIRTPREGEAPIPLKYNVAGKDVGKGFYRLFVPE
ncbi:MAG: hypothetical protein AAF514_07350 [Verrucomicrobiota bacterium]